LTVQESISSGRIVITTKDNYARGQFAAATYAEIDGGDGWNGWPVATSSGSKDDGVFSKLAVAVANDVQRRSDIMERSFEGWKKIDETLVGDEWFEAIVRLVQQ